MDYTQIVSMLGNSGSSGSGSTSWIGPAIEGTGSLISFGGQMADYYWGKDVSKRKFAGNSYAGGSPAAAGVISGAYADVKAKDASYVEHEEPWYTKWANIMGPITTQVGQSIQGQNIDPNNLNALMEGIEGWYAKNGIHIKKENRGKFTSYCGGKVTAECIRKGLHSPSATIRKRANFARNARKWKHAEDGMEIVGPSHEMGGVPMVVVVGGKPVNIEAEGGEEMIKRPNGDVIILNKAQQAQKDAGKPIEKIIQGLPKVKAQNGVVVTPDFTNPTSIVSNVGNPDPGMVIPIETWGSAPQESAPGSSQIGYGSPSSTVMPFEWGDMGPASHAVYDPETNELSGVMVSDGDKGFTGYTVDENGNFVAAGQYGDPDFFDQYQKDLKRSRASAMINNAAQFGTGLTQYLKNKKAKGPDDIAQIGAAYPIFSWLSPDIPLQALERGFIRSLRQAFEFGGRDRASDVYTRYLAGVRDIGSRYAAVNSQGLMGTSQAVAQALNAVNVANADISAKNIATKYQWMKDKSLAMKTNQDLMSKALYANQIVNSQYYRNKLEANIYDYLNQKNPNGLASMFSRGGYPGYYDYSGQAYWGTYDPSQKQQTGLG